jgi:hypothetical protein
VHSPSHRCTHTDTKHAKGGQVSDELQSDRGGERESDRGPIYRAREGERERGREGERERGREGLSIAQHAS